MDDIVKQAMIKWPQVPDCYGWLGLDARGDWYLRDLPTQAAGDFPQAKGQRLEHVQLLAFIGRNYERDARGCWYFQNGPQRVFVELEAAPWILRIDSQGVVHTHTGLALDAQVCLLDELGRVYLDSTRGLGLVHSLDVVEAAAQLELGRWALLHTSSFELPREYGFVRSPRALVPHGA